MVETSFCLQGLQEEWKGSPEVCVLIGDANFWPINYTMDKLSALLMCVGSGVSDVGAVPQPNRSDLSLGNMMGS